MITFYFIEFSVSSILQENQWAKIAKSKNEHTHCAASPSGPFRSAWTLYLSRPCMWHPGPSTWKPGHQPRHQAIHLSQMCRAPLGLGNRVDTWSQSTELATPCRSFHLWQQLHLFLMICPIKEQQNHIQRHKQGRYREQRQHKQDYMFPCSHRVLLIFLSCLGMVGEYVILCDRHRFMPLFQQRFWTLTWVVADEMNYCYLWRLVSAKLITGALVEEGDVRGGAKLMKD